LTLKTVFKNLKTWKPFQKISFFQPCRLQHGS